jgi:hypothetical protein
VRGAGKGTGIFVLAIVLSLGLSVSAGYAAKAKKVASQVEVDAWYWNDDEDMVAVGDVHAKKPKCEKGREVTVIRFDGPFEPEPDEGEGDPMGTAKTDKTGDWDFVIQTNGGDTPEYVTATVARKSVTTKGGKKLTCKGDKAPPLLSD